MAHVTTSRSESETERATRNIATLLEGRVTAAVTVAFVARHRIARNQTVDAIAEYRL